MNGLALLLVSTLACSAPTAVAPANRAPPGAPKYAATLSLRDELRGLLALAEHHWPVTAEHVLRYLSYRARAITRSNEDLARPPWASSVGDPGDTFVELGGDIAGAAIPVDQSKTGQYVQLYVVKGTRDDVAAVVNPLGLELKRTSKIHYDSPDVWIAYPVVAGHQLRVLVQVAYESKSLKVLVHYEH